MTEDGIIGRESLAFFGKIVAGQSHEVTNALNIINELAGLQSDVLDAAESGGPVNLPKLDSICGKIQNQVARAETIIRNIKCFAHSTDTPRAAFSVRENLSRILFLAERWTRLRRTELIASFPDESLMMEADLFLVYHAVFTCIEAALPAADEDRKVTVCYRPVRDGLEIAVESSDPVHQTGEWTVKVAVLRGLMNRCGGELTGTSEDGDRRSFVLFFPKIDRS
jgi:C4-dicarboxylate-specific signal transduction histidine kinase